MRTALFTLFLALFSGFHAQDVCLVSADLATGTHFVVFYEKPANINGIDSVRVYRKYMNTSGVFEHVGSQHILAVSYFSDLSTSSTDTVAYKISYKYSNGSESPLSMGHVPAVLNATVYLPNGATEYAALCEYTNYKIETAAAGYQPYNGFYNVYVDPNGAGIWQPAFTDQGGTLLSWTDFTWSTNPWSHYVMEIEGFSCEITKANINKSRSNIKDTPANNPLSIEELANDVVISPNPASDFIHLKIDESFKSAPYEIVDMSGRTVIQGTLTQPIVNLVDLENGHYTLKIGGNQQLITKRFIKR